MTNKDAVASAVKELEKEKQEEEIKKIKDIVKAILEKIEDRKKREDEIRKERIALEKDLDDLKAGRLDKIHERQGKDPIHDKVTVILVKPVPEYFIPYQPWKSPWVVEIKPYMQNLVNYVTNSAANCTISSTGTFWQNFTGGTYTLGSGNIINL